MTRHFGLQFSVLVVVILLMKPGLGWADTVPVKKTKSDQAPVKERLRDLGVKSATADQQVASLTPAETRYFAQDTSRIQQVGGLQWFELAAGLVFAGILVLFIALTLNHSYLN